MSRLLAPALSTLFVVACDRASQPTTPSASAPPPNPTAFIPAQCYAETELPDGQARNPCYVCHHTPARPNFVDDSDLQVVRTFAHVAQTNPWTNLLADRTAAVEAISDAQALAYVRTSNYRDRGGRLLLAEALRGAQGAGWDQDGNGVWDGFVPDCHFNFDAEGWDRDAAGAVSGWRTYAYAPFPGAFWPTNGSMGDAMIRLPLAYRQGVDGTADLGVYAINLAIMRAAVEQSDVVLDRPADEMALGVDLDRDGHLATASAVAFVFAPLQGQVMQWVGAAGVAQRAGALQPPTAGLLPEGTELLHSVRYLDVRADGTVGMAARMKELRYAKKTRWQTYAQLEQTAHAEVKEKHDFPDRTRQLFGNGEVGIANGRGWRLSGFIEDANGNLRPQSTEETAFCVGCHGGVAANVDSGFTFARMLANPDGTNRWRASVDFAREAIAVRRHDDGRSEVATYLEAARAGDDYGANDEVRRRFFTADGLVDVAAVEGIERDVGAFLLPSPARALQLDKASMALRTEQSYAQGRDANSTPVPWVEREPLGDDAPTGIGEVLHGPRTMAQR